MSLSGFHTDSFLIGVQLGQALCKLLPFFGNVSVVVSTQNLILIAAVSYTHLTLPTKRIV